MNKLRNLFLSLSIFSFLTVAAVITPVSTVLAQASPSSDAGLIQIDCNQIKNEGGFNFNCGASASRVISRIIIIIFIVATVLAFIFLIYGGIKYILSGGSKDGTAAARGMIIAAIIGLALVFLSFLIIKIVGSVVGVDITSPNFKIPTLTGP